MLFFRNLYNDAKNIMQKDPACRNILEVIILYPGFHILVFHRIAHFLYKHRLLFLARLVSQIGRFFTGIGRIFKTIRNAAADSCTEPW